jgi:hypothetical protein
MEHKLNVFSRDDPFGYIRFGGTGFHKTVMFYKIPQKTGRMNYLKLHTLKFQGKNNDLKEPLVGWLIVACEKIE